MQGSRNKVSTIATATSLSTNLSLPKCHFKTQSKFMSKNNNFWKLQSFHSYVMVFCLIGSIYLGFTNGTTYVTSNDFIAGDGSFLKLNTKS